MKKAINKMVRYIGYVLFRPIWWLERLVPRSKNIWVFGAWYGQKYSDNSKWLYEYVLENEPHIKAVWITKNKDIYKKLCVQNKFVCMSASLKGVWWCLRAKYAFLTSGVVDVNALALKGCRQIWLWHGMPLKKILKCDDAYMKINPQKKMIQKLFNPYYTLNSYATITSSDFFIPYLKEAFGIDKIKILKTGLPRCDAFFSYKKERFIEEIKLKFKDAKIFIYMPTFRMASTRDGEKKSLFVKQYGFDLKEFEDFLVSNNIVFLFKPHFVDYGIKIDIVTDRFIYLKDEMYEDLYCLLNNVDALLTDYSSVYFDFLASRKPAFLLPFDYDVYLNSSRSHFFNMFTEMNGQACKNWKDFYIQVKENYNNTEKDLQKFGQYLDGHSSERIVKFLRGMN